MTASDGSKLIGNTVDSEVLEALAQYDSATIQNAGILVRGYVDAELDYSGPDLRRMVGGEATVVGYAVTAELAPVSEQANPGEWTGYYDTMAYAGVPTIAVLKDVDDPPRRGAIIGDGMAYRHRALGCVGAVVDGNARDVPGIDGAGLALWATGRVPGHGPFHILRHGVSVTVAGLRIEPGDILVCDGDGVARVPVDMAAAVADKAAEVRRREWDLHTYFASPAFTLDDYEAWKRR